MPPPSHHIPCRAEPGGVSSTTERARSPPLRCQSYLATGGRAAGGGGGPAAARLRRRRRRRGCGGRRSLSTSRASRASWSPRCSRAAPSGSNRPPTRPRPCPRPCWGARRRRARSRVCCLAIAVMIAVAGPWAGRCAPPNVASAWVVRGSAARGCATNVYKELLGVRVSHACFCDSQWATPRAARKPSQRCTTSAAAVAGVSIGAATVKPVLEQVARADHGGQPSAGPRAAVAAAAAWTLPKSPDKLRPAPA